MTLPTKLSPLENVEFPKELAGCPLNHHTTEDLEFTKQHTRLPLR